MALGPKAETTIGGASRGRVEQPGVLDLVVLPPVVDGLARPQLPDDLHRLLQHGQAHPRRRPAVAQDVLVEGLARPDAEEEPALEQQRRGGGGLGDDRGMDAHDGAGDADAHPQPLGGGGDPAEHRPHERAVALGASPTGGSGRRSRRSRSPAPPPSRRCGPGRTGRALRSTGCSRRRPSLTSRQARGRLRRSPYPSSSAPMPPRWSVVRPGCGGHPFRGHRVDDGPHLVDDVDGEAAAAAVLADDVLVGGHVEQVILSSLT